VRIVPQQIRARAHTYIYKLKLVVNSLTFIFVRCIAILITFFLRKWTTILVQVFRPWIQSRRLEYLLRKYVQKNLLPSLLTAGGRPNKTLIRE
jgi:hypothetical protein